MLAEFPSRRFAKFVVAIALLVAGVSIVVLVSKNSVATPELAIYSRCHNDPESRSCYAREVPQVARELSMEQAFAIASVLQQKDTAQFPICHDIGHKIASIEVAKDPPRWAQVLKRCPRYDGGSCSTGCLHGAFLGGIASSTGSVSRALIDQLKAACGDPYREMSEIDDAGVGACFHGIGHLLIFVTDANVKRAVSVCDQIVPADAHEGRFRRQCYDGAFMEVFQPQTPEDVAQVAVIAPKSVAESVPFCAQMRGDARRMCHRESYAIHDESLLQPSAIEAFCKEEGPLMRDCEDQLTFVYSDRVHYDISLMTAFCQGFSADRARCTEVTARAMANGNPALRSRAIQYCANATKDCPK